MKVVLTLMMCCSVAAMSQAPARTPDSPIKNIHVLASEIVWEGILSGGIKLTGLIDGQPVVLREFKEKSPIAPGTYTMRLSHNDRPHGSEMDQRYIVTLQDGKQLTFYLEAVCERDAAVCYGVSLR